MLLNLGACRGLSMPRGQEIKGPTAQLASGVKAPRSSLEELPPRTPTTSVPTATPKTKPGFPAPKFNTFPPRRVRDKAVRSSLPDTPGYGAVEPLAPLLRGVRDYKDGKPEKSPLGDDVDEQAIWVACAERLDFASDVAATQAWARIFRERAGGYSWEETEKELPRLDAWRTRRGTLSPPRESSPIRMPDGRLSSMKTVGAQTAQKDRHEMALESVRSASSVQVFSTETAERVEMKRVRIKDVDCRGVAGRRESLKQGVDNTTMTLPCRTPMAQQSNGGQTQNSTRRYGTTQRSPPPQHPSAAAPLPTPSNILESSKALSGTPTTKPQTPTHPWEAAWHHDLPIPSAFPRSLPHASGILPSRVRPVLSFRRGVRS
ncbi:uncharacterized protein N0V89_011240 [Didymosphaeria variabile]|uniref:Uncharacterized protein n=1 Tax=Didymosphaeria variabile TaxID=1932322 RepID=A0A9W9C682_9PLEO|nr:uncharacterized protein N0V89_011240 [Didymosphaeria variabile]KAJ4347300.1 hypothetical protein N0V89_011240 [Didymosphaeria variabile]